MLSFRPHTFQLKIDPTDKNVHKKGGKNSKRTTAHLHYCFQSAFWGHVPRNYLLRKVKKEG